MQIDNINNNNPGGSKISLNERFNKIQGVTRKRIMNKFRGKTLRYKPPSYY